MSSSPPSDTPLVEHYKSRNSTSTQPTPTPHPAPSSSPSKVPLSREVASLKEFQGNFHDLGSPVRKKRRLVRRSDVKVDMTPSDEAEVESPCSPIYDRQKKVMDRELVHLLKQQGHMKELRNPTSGKRKSSQQARDIISRAMAMTNYDDEEDEDEEDEVAGFSEEALGDGENMPKKSKKSRRSEGRSHGPAQGEAKGRYIGYHIEDANLPVYARFYPNGTLITRVYKEDVTEETFLRWPSIFQNNQKGLVKFEKIVFDKTIFDDSGDGDIQTLSISEKKNRVRDYLSPSKGKLIGYHIDFPTLPVYAGRYASSAVYARVYKDDATPEMLGNSPGTFAPPRRGQVEFDEIRFEKELFANDIQTLPIEQKRKRVEQYLSSLPNATSTKNKQAVNMSEVATVEANDSEPAKTPGARSITYIHIGYWTEAPEYPVYAYIKPNKPSGSLCFRCKVEDIDEDTRELFSTWLRYGAAVKYEFVQFLDGIEKESPESTKKYIRSLLVTAGARADGEIDNGDAGGDVGADDDGEDDEQEPHKIWASVCEVLKRYDAAVLRHNANLEATIAKKDDIMKEKDDRIKKQEAIVLASATTIAQQNTAIQNLQSEIADLAINARDTEKQAAEIVALQAEIDTLKPPATRILGGKSYKLIQHGPNKGIYVFDGHSNTVVSSGGHVYIEWLAFVEAKPLNLGNTDPALVRIDNEYYQRINEVGNNHHGMLVQVGQTISQVDGVDVVVTKVRREV